MEKIRKIKVDSSKVRMAVDAGIPLVITTYKLPHEMEEYMSEVLENFLRRLNHTDCIDGLSYCLKELVNNAKKANTKRVYFEDKKLNIEDPEQYKQGMLNFKNDTITGIQYYLQRQKEKGLYIKVFMTATENNLQVEVRNNVELTVFEYKRIHDKLSRSMMYNSVEEGFDQLLDDTEGAGLGLVIMILILRRAGLSEESYEVICENGETITRVTLPFTSIYEEDVLPAAKNIADLVECIPDFEDNLMFVNKILVNPSNRLSDISRAVSNDPALAANLLKEVCSQKEKGEASFCTLKELLTVCGRRKVRALIYELSSREDYVLPENEANRLLWTHSCRVAFYASNIAANLCGIKDEELLDRLYFGGLLHDLGKIVFENPHPSLTARFEEFCGQKKLVPSTVHDAFCGYRHADSGALIADKWNFPACITAVIKYHHQPEKAPEDYRQMAEMVQFADLMVHYVDRDMFYEQFPQKLLDKYGIKDEAQMIAICNTLEKYAPGFGKASGDGAQAGLAAGF